MKDGFSVFFCFFYSIGLLVKKYQQRRILFLSTRCGGEDTTNYAAQAKHACASGVVSVFHTSRNSRKKWRK